MRRHPFLYLGIGIAAVLACAVFFYSTSGAKQVDTQNISADTSAGVFAAAQMPVDASSTVTIAGTEPSLAPPANSKKYQNSMYHFSFYYPNDLSVSEKMVGGNSMILLFQDKTNEEGFQIFITPYSEPKITQERFEMDEPSGVMNDSQNITIDGAAATEFFSTNQAMGASRELWFLHGGWLYEVTAPQPLDAWLLQIMQTWTFI